MSGRLVPGRQGVCKVQGPDRHEPEETTQRLHVSALLAREGHPLRNEPEIKGAGRGRVKMGLAAGSVLVAGAVVAGALGLTSGPNGHTDNAAQPLPGGAGHGAAGGVTEYPAQDVHDGSTGAQNAAPRVEAPQTTSPEAAAPTSQARPAPAPTTEHATPKPHHSSPAPTHQQPTSSQPAPTQPSSQQQTQTQTKKKTVGSTLQDVLTPVTGAVDDTLQPALSMIPSLGGLLGG